MIKVAPLTWINYKIRKEWDLIYGADDVCSPLFLMKSIVLMHSCTPAYVIRHPNRAFKFLQKRISHGQL